MECKIKNDINEEEERRDEYLKEISKEIRNKKKILRMFKMIRQLGLKEYVQLKSKGNIRRRVRSERRFRGECYNCGEEGHHVNNCPKRKVYEGENGQNSEKDLNGEGYQNDGDEGWLMDSDIKQEICD
jgi:hypothetical protein